MKKGDIVLIPFPFTDLLGNKNRPAVVLIDSGDDVTVCFMTTQPQWQSQYDLSIEPSDTNGLKKTTILRLNKFATLDKNLILGRMGSLEKHHIRTLNFNLIRILQLST